MNDKRAPQPGAYRPKLDNVRGILWMLAAVTLLTAMFAIIKQMATELPFFVVALMRTSVALVLFVPWLVRVGPSGIATRRLKTHFLRAFFGIASFACVVYAVGRLMLSDAMVLSFTSPFWSILLSGLILGEAIRRDRTFATIAGFVGVVMIVKPHGQIDHAMLIALGSAVLTSGAIISLKSLSRTEPPARIVFYFFLFGTLFLLPPAILTWETPGVLGGVGQNFLARAYDAGEVTIIAPLDFLRMPLAALFGFAVFAEIPDVWSAAGTAVIISALLFIARRDAVERRRQREETGP